MTLPNFIIGGAPKCGTTALWGYLNEHPEVFLSPFKEPRFFTEIEGELEKGIIGSGPSRAGTYFRGLAWYERRFQGHAGEKAVGEATTDYFAAPDAAELIRRHIPDVRLIFMLRDPVDRMFSHYWEERRLGCRFPDFHDMVRTGHPRLEYYAYVSSYRQHLERFADAFGRRQLLVLLASDLRSDPVRCLAQVCDFLQVNEAFAPASLGKTYNPQALPRVAWLQRTILRAQGFRATRRLPDPIRLRLGRIRKRVMQWNAVRNDYTALVPEIKQQLVGRFQEDVRFVEAWTGRDLRSWLDVAVDRPGNVASR
jgi:hypothetical protein